MTGEHTHTCGHAHTHTVHTQGSQPLVTLPTILLLLYRSNYDRCTHTLAHAHICTHTHTDTSDREDKPKVTFSCNTK